MVDTIKYLKSKTKPEFLVYKINCIYKETHCDYVSKYELPVLFGKLNKEFAKYNLILKENYIILSVNSLPETYRIYERISK